MADFYADLVKILRDNGCTLVRKGKGSREIWHSPINNRHVNRSPDDQVSTHGK